LGALGERFLNGRQPSLEAQVCNLADEIAYNNHDVDDGLRSGLITLGQLRSVKLFSRHLAEVDRQFPGLADRRRIHETIRCIIGAQVADLLVESASRITRSAPQTAPDVFAAPPLIAFSAAMHEENRALKMFLREQLYRHYQVVRMTTKAQRVIRELFSAFMAEPRLLPPQYQEIASAESLARATSDYIAGMTDRYAIKEHRRLFLVGEA
jgi:dGTPase